jgi:hypothetical protein
VKLQVRCALSFQLFHLVSGGAQRRHAFQVGEQQLNCGAGKSVCQWCGTGDKWKGALTAVAPAKEEVGRHRWYGKQVLQQTIKARLKSVHNQAGGCGVP